MRRALLLCVTIAIVPSSALAFECTLDKTSCLVAPRWVSRIVPYTVEAPPPEAGIDHESFRRAVRASFERWSEPLCTDLQVEEQAASPYIIRIVTEGWSRAPSAAAFTNLSFDGVTGTITKATIDVNFQDHQFSVDSCLEDALDLEAVLTHEAGHYIGLAHPCALPGEELMQSAEGDALPPCPKESCDSLLTRVDDPDNTILWPIAMSCETAFRDLGPDDVEGVCSIYPRGAKPLPCAKLPNQEEPYVSNAPFGCSASAANHAATNAGELILFGLFAAAIISRKR